MSNPRVAPYGSWKSPITAKVVSGEAVSLSYLAIDAENVYWIESRPQEEGRSVIVRWSPEGQITDCIPEGFNARTRVHEYGGGAYLVENDLIFFSNFNDQRLYRQERGGEPMPITPPEDLRYADGVLDRKRSRLIIVREDHTIQGEPINSLVSLDINKTTPGTILASGYDFYSSPRISPDGSQLAWLCWNHPNMPWDGTELWVADILEDGSLGDTKQVAGGAEESIFQPEWSPDGVLYFVSDRSGWWNLFRQKADLIEAMTEIEAEFGRPQWVFGQSLYGFGNKDRIICCYYKKGTWHLAALDLSSKSLEEIDTPFTEIRMLKAAPGFSVFLGSSPSDPESVVKLDSETHQLEVIYKSRDLKIKGSYFSIPKPIEFPTMHGKTAHGLYYAPQNPDYQAPKGENPPLIVISHGGPTSATTTALRYSIQFWTSRGFAVFDVNYGGSTGYGRAYRERLNREWGVVDVQDCIAGAEYLVESSLADKDRLLIRGGSAGGFTTLAALTFHDAFKAGASYYGVSDLEALASDTHKFESRYLDNLVGPYPEKVDVYQERSPIHFTDRISCPVIFFQGLEDAVVHPDQSKRMFDAIRSKGIPTAYLPFEGEQHGFRRKENQIRALEAELYFYSKVLEFDLADEIEPVEIVNL